MARPPTQDGDEGTRGREERDHDAGVNRGGVPPAPHPDDPGPQDSDIAGPPITPDPRALVRLSAEIHLVAQETRRALRGDTTIYQRGGRLVRVTTSRPPRARWLSGAAGLPVIEEWMREPMRERISERVCFLRFDERSKRSVAAAPPGWLADLVLDGADLDAPLLDAVLPAPTLRPDGSVLDAPGYDADTGCYLAPHGLDVRVPERLDLDDARHALGVLDELLEDFPFEAAHDRSAVLAAILTACVRTAILGPCPLTLISGNAPGTGKSLLADVVSTIALGRAAPRMAVSTEDEEMRKRITTIALAGLRLVLLDNIDSRVRGGALGGSAFDAVLTSDEWQDRVLGANRMATLPMRTLWIATGNNVAIRGDLLRRVVPVRLVSPIERPEERDGFAIPRLLDHVREHRSWLLTCALVAVRAWCLAGQPSQGLAPIGSFEAWSDIVRGALVWAGYADPAAGRAALRETADPEVAGVGALLAEWHVVLGSGPLTTAQVCAHQEVDLREALVEVASRAGAPSSRALGYVLRAYRDRVIGGYVIRQVSDHAKARTWRVERIG